MYSVKEIVVVAHGIPSSDVVVGLVFPMIDARIADENSDYVCQVICWSTLQKL